MTSLPAGPELVEGLVWLSRPVGSDGSEVSVEPGGWSPVDAAGAVAVTAAWQRVTTWTAARRDVAAAEVAQRLRAQPVDLVSPLPRRRPGQAPDPQVERMRRLRQVARSLSAAHERLYALTLDPAEPFVDPTTGEILDPDTDTGLDGDGQSAVLADAIAVASAASEVGLAAGVSDHAARQWITTARTLGSGRLPHAAAAAQAGVLDRAKTRDLVAATHELSAEAATAVDAAVVPHGCMPDPQALTGREVIETGGLRAVAAFRDAVTAAVVVADPDAAADRAARRRRDRSVRIGPVDEVLARLEWLLPIERAAHVKALLDAGVAAARTADREARCHARAAAEAAGQPYTEPETPTADELRDDVLYDLLTHDTVPGLRQALLDHTLTDHAPTDHAPTDHAPTDHAPTDHAPTDHAPTDHAPATGPADPVPPEAAPVAPPVERTGDARRLPVQVLVHIPFDVLFGNSRAPAVIEGVGPVTADLARSLAADADWRCAVTDPDHGTVLGLGRRTYTPAYQPTAALRRLLAAGQHTCGKPGCRTRATHCDIDHLVNHPDGATCTCNTELKCRRDHLLKTFAGWRTTPSTRPADPPGAVIWTTPTGHRYLSRPFSLPTAFTTLSTGLVGGVDESVAAASGNAVEVSGHAGDHPAVVALRAWKADLAAHREYHARRLADLEHDREARRRQRPPPRPPGPSDRHPDEPRKDDPPPF